MNKEKVYSPITNTNNVIECEAIDKTQVIELYKKKIDYDVSKYFESIEVIKIYKCLDSGYRFYYPFDIYGGSEFYEYLETFSWYYMDWKWEHEKTIELLGSTKKLLEIGCGNAKFLEQCKKLGFDCTGLELNEKAVDDAKKRDLKVLNETVQKHSTESKNEYDTVCSFQVLEHISDVNSFITSSINCLKKSGKMIISVPNNDSFIGLDNKNIFNLPPHHMGLWDSTSLKNLEKFYPIKLTGVYYEPLQEYHKMSFYHVLTRPFKQKYGVLGKFLARIIRPIVSSGIDNLSDSILGHSILVIYEKTE